MSLNLCETCDKNLENPFFCKNCKKLIEKKELPGFFETLNVAPEFDLDIDFLESCYENFLMDVHPDFFSGESSGEKMLSLKYSAHLKSAFDSLKNPYERSMLLLKHKFDKTPSDKELMPSPEFLKDIFEIQEKIESRQSGEETHFKTLKLVEELLETLSEFFKKDEGHDPEKVYREITQNLGKLKFLINLKNQIEAGT